jgi:hypothetical protein
MLGVGEGVGAGVGDADAEGVGVGVATAVGVAVGVGDLVGTGFLMLTPLFQTNFLPDLTQVYLMPADVLVWPCLLQEVPGFAAAVASD